MMGLELAKFSNITHYTQYLSDPAAANHSIVTIKHRHVSRGWRQLRLILDNTNNTNNIKMAMLAPSSPHRLYLRRLEGTFARIAIHQLATHHITLSQLYRIFCVYFCSIGWFLSYFRPFLPSLQSDCFSFIPAKVHMLHRQSDHGIIPNESPRISNKWTRKD